MVLMVCSSQYIQPLLPCIYHSGPNLLPMGMISIGFAQFSQAPMKKITPYAGVAQQYIVVWGSMGELH
jgi:hypothetical protein